MGPTATYALSDVTHTALWLGAGVEEAHLLQKVI